MEIVEYDFMNQLNDAYKNKLETKKTKCMKQSTAATKIQATYIAHRYRENFLQIKKTAVMIQSAYRRKVTVLKTQKIYDATQFQKRQKFYADMATRIQAMYRGYASRKYILNAEARRIQIQEMALAAADQAELCREYNQHCEEMVNAEKKEKQMKVISQLGKLHHLVSTKAIPGIFKPNYPLLAPSIDGKKIDEVLKQEGLRQAKQGLRKSGPVKILDNIARCVRTIK